MSDIKATLDGINQSITSTQGALDSLLATSLSPGGKAFESLAASVGQVSAAMSGVVSASTTLLKSLPGGAILSAPFQLMGSAIELVSAVGSTFNTVMMNMISGIDSFSNVTRTLNTESYAIAASFGLSFDAAKDFTQLFLESATKLSGADFGRITMRESADAAKALGDSGISFKTLSSSVDTASGSMELYAASILHAKSLGIDTSKYAGLLSNAIIKQGLTAEDAMEQMSGFGATSKETGLALSDIASNLQGLSNNFNKLGLSAEFGRPLLEGFTKTLSGMGLGIENALDLSTSLGTALVGLTKNYASAYVTFQKGGLDMGGSGGGALGSSISMQAKLLEIEKSGGDQSQLAQEMAGAMRDTLASFTGGNIVTVQQADKDPALASTYYAQTKLLSQLYGISEDDGARTLDYLSQIDKAISSGDEDLAQKLAADLQNGTKARNETLSSLDKLNAETEGQKSRLLSINKTIIEASQLTGEALVQALIDPQKAILNDFSSKMENANANLDLKAYQDKLGNVTDDLREAVENPTAMIQELMSELTGSISDVIRSTNSGIKDVSDKGVMSAINMMTTQIGNLVNELRGQNNGREDKKIP